METLFIVGGWCFVVGLVLGKTMEAMRWRSKGDHEYMNTCESGGRLYRVRCENDWAPGQIFPVGKPGEIIKVTPCADRGCIAPKCYNSGRVPRGCQFAHPDQPTTFHHSV